LKLTKAIEILDLNIKEAGKKMPADTLDSLKLGVEALTVIGYLRNAERPIRPPLLSGETEER